MFWWAVPVGHTGLLIFLLSLIIILVLSLLIDIDDLHDFIECSIAVKIIVGSSVLIFVIGLLMMTVGFFFWALGEIWMPYL